MDDGVVYRFMWEVKTDRRDSVGSSTDQWISRERSCRLVALFVNVRSICEVENSEEIQIAWDEALEIPPKSNAPVAKPNNYGTAAGSEGQTYAATGSKTKEARYTFIV
jgi:hypothetical protein